MTEPTAPKTARHAGRCDDRSLASRVARRAPILRVALLAAIAALGVQGCGGNREAVMQVLPGRLSPAEQSSITDLYLSTTGDQILFDVFLPVFWGTKRYVYRALAADGTVVHVKVSGLNGRQLVAFGQGDLVIGNSTQMDILMHAVGP